MKQQKNKRELPSVLDDVLLEYMKAISKRKDENGVEVVSINRIGDAFYMSINIEKISNEAYQKVYSELNNFNTSKLYRILDAYLLSGTIQTFTKKYRKNMDFYKQYASDIAKNASDERMESFINNIIERYNINREIINDEELFTEAILEVMAFGEAL